MTCDEARDRIEESQLDLLTGSEADEFACHLAQCSACRAESDEAARFAQVLIAARDPDADARLTARLERAAPKATRRRALWRILALAALLLIAATAWWSGVPGSLPTGKRTTLAGGREIALERAQATVIDGAQATQLGTRDVRLHSGSMRFRVEPNSGSFAVRTPRGTVRVTGTEFEVQIMSSGTSLKVVTGVAVLVATGAVLYALDGREQAVTAGELLVDIGEGDPQTFRATDIRDLVVEHQTQQRELQRLKGRLERMQKDLAARQDATSKPAIDPSAAGDAALDPKDGSVVDVKPDTSVDAIAGTDWTRITAAIAARYADSDKRPTRAERMQMMTEFTYLEARLQAIAEEKGLGSVGDAALHPDVIGRLLDAALPGLLPKTDAVLRDRVRERLLSTTKAALQGLTKPYLAIEQQWVRVRSAVGVGDALRGQLPVADLQRVLRAWVDAKFINSTSVSMSSGTAAQLEARVVAGWKRRLEIDEELPSGALDVARGFVDAIHAVRMESETTHGAELAGSAFNAVSAEGAEDFGNYLDQLRICDAVLKVHCKTERELLAQLPSDDRQALVESGLSLWSFKITD